MVVHSHMPLYTALPHLLETQISGQNFGLKFKVQTVYLHFFFFFLFTGETDSQRLNHNATMHLQRHTFMKEETALPTVMSRNGEKKKKNHGLWGI